jgi:MFS family permease
MPALLEAAARRLGLLGLPPEARRIVLVRGMRSFADGFSGLAMPLYLLALGYDAFEVGVISTVTLIGSAASTLVVGMVAHRYDRRLLLLAAALTMAATGIGLAGFEALWPLLVVAAVGTFNPSAGDVSFFIPVEQSLLGDVAAPERRTATFALFSLVGAVAVALGSLFIGVVDWLAPRLGLVETLKGLFLLYGLVGALAFAIYRRLPPLAAAGGARPRQALGPSRGRVVRLALLFSLDSFAGGFVLRPLLALWLFERFDISVVAAGTVFFWSSLLSASSYPLSAWLARRIGLVNTMVFTHLPANVLLMLVPLMPEAWLAVALLLLRSPLSTMDVPARTSYVIAVVTPPERAAAASLTAVPRSLASAASPALGGYLFALSPFGWPLVLAGALKIAYDLLLLRGFGRVKPPEEAVGPRTRSAGDSEARSSLPPAPPGPSRR